MLLTAACLVALAVDPATMTADGVTPIATPDHVRTCMDALQLSDSARDTMSLVFEDYQFTLGQAHTEAMASMAGARAQLDDAFAGRVRLDADRLRALREIIVAAPMQSWTLADAGLAELADTASLMATGPVHEVNAAIAAFQCAVMQDSVPDDGRVVNAALALNVQSLALEAMQDELQGVTAQQIATALQNYARALHQGMPEWFRQSRADGLTDATMDIHGDRDGRVQVMQRSAQRWQALDVLHGQAVTAIGALAEAAGGPGAKSAWLQRAQRARFPDLYDDRQLLASHAWIMKNGSAAQQQSAEHAWQQWQVQTQEIATRIVQLMRQALEQGGDLQADAVAWVPALAETRRTWLQASGDRQVQLEAARASMERGLSEGQRAAIRRSMIDQRRR